VDSLFVVAGIHAKDVGYEELATQQQQQQQQTVDSAAADAAPEGPAQLLGVTQGGRGTWQTQQLKALLQHHGQQPTYVTAALSW
jgi:hypothetical protein